MAKDLKPTSVQIKHAKQNGFKTSAPKIPKRGKSTLEKYTDKMEDFEKAYKSWAADVKSNATEYLKNKKKIEDIRARVK